MKPYIAREHEFEAQHGLPETLPEGERILWQGAPTWFGLARQVFHVDMLALYFVAMLLWRFTASQADGASAVEALQSLTVLLPLSLLALGLLCLVAWLSARSTAYTLTDRRVVMRIGIVLTVTYNLPLKCITAADLRPGAGRSGDLCLALEPDTHIAWLHLWPHVRPWQVKNPQPMLRALDDAKHVARLLGQAWTASNGAAALAPRIEAAASTEPRTPSRQPTLANS